MHVFVWVHDCGNTVNRAETKEDILHIVREINAIAKINTNRQAISASAISKMIDKSGVEKSRKWINSFVTKIVNRHQTNDLFDWGSGFTTILKGGK
jgi:hypothetical protein